MTTEQKELERYGYTVFSSGQNEATLELASKLGTVCSPKGWPQVQTLIPCKNDSVSSYSGNYGMNAFPFHTDLAHWHLPPRYFLLHCIRPSENVHTTFLSAVELFQGIDKVELRRALFRPRPKLDGRLSFLRLYEHGLYRWDSLFICPMNKTGLTLKNLIEDRITKAKVKSYKLTHRGDCILVDNWRVIHGRSAVSRKDLARVVERVYLKDIKL